MKFPNVARYSLIVDWAWKFTVFKGTTMVCWEITPNLGRILFFRLKNMFRNYINPMDKAVKQEVGIVIHNVSSTGQIKLFYEIAREQYRV